MPPVTLGVVVPTFGSTEPLRRTLESLCAADRPDSLRGIWVVENGRPRGARNVVAAHSRTRPLHYLWRKEAGLSGARNLGFAEADVDVVLFFDNDLRFERGTLSAYDRAVQAHGTGCFYGGPLAPEYETPPDESLLPHLPFSARGFTLGDADRQVDEPVFLGANHAIPKAAVPGGDPYDPVAATGRSGGGVGEESRLQERLLAQGARGYYVADALVWHRVPAANCTLRWLLRRYYRHGYTDGLADAERGAGEPTLLGYPRWTWGVLRKKWSAALRARWRGRERGVCVEKSIALHRHRGYMAGRRAAERALRRTREGDGRSS